MNLRNAFRLLGANFSLVWKNLAYKLIIIAIFGSAMVGFGLDIISTLSAGGFFVAFKEFWVEMFLMNTQEFSTQIVSLLNNFVELIADNATALMPNIIGVSVALILGCIFMNMANLPMAEVIKGHMSSLSKFGFCGAYLRDFGRSLKQAIVLFIVRLPFYAIIFVSGYYILNFMTVSSLWAVLSPMLFIILAVIVLSLENTLFSCFTPYLCLHNVGTFRALQKGVNTVSKRFYRTWSNYIVYVLLAFVINFVCARYTYGVALFITLPMTIVFYNIYNMVVYYESQGMRYYIDSSSIIKTKEFAEQDSIIDAKLVV